MLCDDPEGWDGVGGGRKVQEGGDVCTLGTDSCRNQQDIDVQQKPAGHCKAVILQLKINKF